MNKRTTAIIAITVIIYLALTTFHYYATRQPFGSDSLVHWAKGLDQNYTFFQTKFVAKGFAPDLQPAEAFYKYPPFTGWLLQILFSLLFFIPPQIVFNLAMIAITLLLIPYLLYREGGELPVIFYLALSTAPHLTLLGGALPQSIIMVLSLLAINATKTWQKIGLLVTALFTHYWGVILIAFILAFPYLKKQFTNATQGE